MNKVMDDLYSVLRIRQDSQIEVKEKGGLFAKTLDKKDVNLQLLEDAASADKDIHSQVFGSVSEEKEAEMEQSIGDKTLNSIIRVSEELAEKHSK